MCDIDRVCVHGFREGEYNDLVCKVKTEVVNGGSCLIGSVSSNGLCIEKVDNGRDLVAISNLQLWRIELSVSLLEHSPLPPHKHSYKPC